MKFAVAKLRAGHVQPVWAGHPWVFKQAIESVEGHAEPGDVVEVADPKGHALGAGFYSPSSAIPIRIAARSASELAAPGWLAGKLEAALRWRERWLGLPSEETTGFRWVHSEGDGVPGLIVDVYGRAAVVQFLTLGMKLREQEVFHEVQRIGGVEHIVEVASASSQKLERFRAETREVLGGPLAALEFSELGLHYSIARGDKPQKTGYYFDQREHRAWLQQAARGKKVLDAYCYVGGFALAAAKGGAERVYAIDSSVQAIAEGAILAKHNHLPETIEFVKADVPRELHRLLEDGETFDLAVVDPPKFAPTVRNLAQSVKMYRKVNAMALRLVNPGGLMMTCSCSAALQPEHFLRMLAMASVDAGRTIRLLRLSGAAPDHPSLPSFPQGRYLKCALLLVE